MSKFYVGVKIVFAYPRKESEGGRDGYIIRYPDGYESWSPKAVFEAAYLPMGESNDNTVTPEMVDKFMGSVIQVVPLPDQKTTHVGVEMISGFTQYDTSACVDPKNYNQDIGKELALKKIKDRLWGFLGFVVQWGKYGLKGNI